MATQANLAEAMRLFAEKKAQRTTQPPVVVTNNAEQVADERRREEAGKQVERNVREKIEQEKPTQKEAKHIEDEKPTKDEKLAAINKAYQAYTENPNSKYVAEGVSIYSNDYEPLYRLANNNRMSTTELWLSDVDIDYMIKHARGDNTNIVYLPTQELVFSLAGMVPYPTVETGKTILMPIISMDTITGARGSHWVLLVVRNRNAFYFDSMDGGLETGAGRTAQDIMTKILVKQNIVDDININIRTVRTQTDGWSCGYHVVTIAHAIIDNEQYIATTNVSDDSVAVNTLYDKLSSGQFQRLAVDTAYSIVNNRTLTETAESVNEYYAKYDTSTLVHMLEDMTIENRRLKAELDNPELACTTSNQLLVTYKTQIDDLQKEKTILTRGHKLETEKNVTLNAEINHLKNTAKQTQDTQTKQLRLDNENLNAEIDHLKNTAKQTHNTQTTSHKIANDRHQLQIDGLQTEIERLKKQINDTKQGIADTTLVNNQQHRLQIDALEKERTDLRKKYNVLFQAFTDAAPARDLSQYKLKSGGFAFSEPTPLSELMNMKALQNSLNALSATKGVHSVTLRVDENDGLTTGSLQIDIPNAKTVKDPATQTPACVVSFDKETRRVFSNNSPLRNDTIFGNGRMRVELRGAQGQVIRETVFDYDVRPQSDQLGYVLRADNVRLYLHSLGEGTYKLKMLTVDM